MPEKTEKKEHRWRKGESGNPAGRPRGARNKTTLAVQELLRGEAEALTRRAVERALEGDVTALRLCLDRIAPAPKDGPLPALKLPDLTSANMAEASASVIRAVAAGRLTPSEGQALAGLLEGHRRCLELTDIENRLTALERKGEDE